MYKYIYKGVAILSILFLFALPASAAQVAYWSFNGSDGIVEDTAIDNAGDNDGVIHGAVAVAGKIGQALSFDGINDYINCGHDTSLNITSAITVEMWVKIDEAALHNGGLVTKDDATNRQFNMMYFHGTPDFRWRIWQSDGTNKQVKSNSVTKGVWYHIVGVADGSYVRLYLNGISVGTPVSYDGTIKSFPALDVHIGFYNVERFEGTIDEVRIYDEALSPAQILINYQKGRNVKLNPDFAGKILMNPDASGKLRFGEN